MAEACQEYKNKPVLIGRSVILWELWQSYSQINTLDRGRCRWVPPGELPINTPAFSLTWRLVPDRKTETKKECKSKHEGRNPFFSEGDMKICLLEGTGAAKRMWSFHCWEELFAGWLTHLFFIFYTSFFFCLSSWWNALNYYGFQLFTRLPWTRILFCRVGKHFRTYKYDKDLYPHLKVYFTATNI